MRSKLGFLTSSGLKRKLTNKWFITINILLLFLIPIIINIDNIIKVCGGDFLQPTNIYLIDHSGDIFDEFEDSFKKNNKIVLKQNDIKVKHTDRQSKYISKRIKKDKSKDIIVEVSKDEKEKYNAEIISYKEIDSFLYQNIVNSLNDSKHNFALKKSDIDTEKLASINENINTKRIYLLENTDEKNDMLKTIGNYLIPIFIIPFFFLIIMVVSMIGSEINEEKSSKSMEVIISSVSPKTHFISKLLYVNIFAIIQEILILIYGAIGVGIRVYLTNSSSLLESINGVTGDMAKAFINSSIFTNFIHSMPIFVILLVLSFVAYSLVAGILASVTTNAEDYSQIQIPLIIILMFAYYLVIMASTYESSTFIHVMAYVPFISAIVAPVLLILGQIKLTEIIIATFILVLTNTLLIIYGLRIYKVGILNYNSNKLWTTIAKAIRKKY